MPRVNRRLPLVAAVAADAPNHEANAEAVAAFASNHYAKEIEKLTAQEVREFLEEYYPRNAWPSDRQRAAVERSLAYVFEVTETAPPKIIAERR